jgi:hypothetical protein
MLAGNAVKKLACAARAVLEAAPPPGVVTQV